VRALLLLLAGCNASPCEPTTLAPGGDVLRGLAFGDGVETAISPDGTLACATCGELFTLAPGAARPSGHALPGYVRYYSTAWTAGTDADVYFAASRDSGMTYALDHDTLDGAELWSVAVARPDLIRTTQDVVYVYSGDSTTAYSAADGSLRWQMDGVYYPDGTGGVIETSYGGSAASEPVIALDAALVQRWTKTLTASSTTPAAASVAVEPPVVTASGQLVVWGALTGTSLDLGDATLTATTGTFVAALDRTSGATSWTYALPAAYTVTVAGDDVLLWRDLLQPFHGVEVTILDSTGAARTDTLAIDVPYTAQSSTATVLGSSDQTFWVALDLYCDADASTVDISVGSQHYHGSDRLYVFNIAL